MVNQEMVVDIKSERIFGLDVFRALAIVLVVMGHGSFMLNGTMLEGFPFFKMIDGVDMFFVLSGFLIGGILLRSFNDKEAFHFFDLMSFWKRRWFRTLPNYYLILILNYAFVKYEVIHESIDQFDFHFFTFTQNFKTPFYGFFWESWSLSIEEWFYILVPFCGFLLLKLCKPKFAFLTVTILILVLPFVYRWFIYNPNIDGFWYDVTFRKTVLSRLDSIGYGLLAAWAYFYYLEFWNKMKFACLFLGIVMLIFVVNYESPVTSIYRQVVYFSLLPFSVMLLVPAVMKIRKFNTLLSISIEHISKISYSMYLVNLALVAEVIRDNFAPQGGFDGILKYICYWCIVVIVSSILYKYFEKPMMKLRDKDFLSWRFR
jgi:peptidoglycan/LPS O-acetylase OafA/YrhL